MIDYAALIHRIAFYKVTRDGDMPFAYRRSNPQGRPLHDDWPWPFSKIPRMATAYRVPLPFLKVSGNALPRWMPWQEGYPEAPEAVFRPALPGSEAHARGCLREVLAYDPVLPSGQSGTFAAYLCGKWTTCYYTSSSILFGRRLHTNRGLKPDLTLGDFMAWIEASLTWTAIAKLRG